MPRTCSVCTHKEAAAINRALLNGTSYRDIAGRFGISRSAAARHKEHLNLVEPDAADELSEAAREAKNQYQREWRQGMSEEARAAKNAYYREWRQKNPDKVREYTRRYWEKRANG